MASKASKHRIALLVRPLTDCVYVARWESRCTMKNVHYHNTYFPCYEILARPPHAVLLCLRSCYKPEFNFRHWLMLIVRDAVFKILGGNGSRGEATATAPTFPMKSSRGSLQGLLCCRCRCCWGQTTMIGNWPNEWCAVLVTPDNRWLVLPRIFD